MARQIKDTGGAVLPLLGYKLNGASKINYSTTVATTVSIPADVQVYTITPTTDCYIEFADVSTPATSSSHYFIGGLPYDIAIGSNPRVNYISIIAASAAGTLFISERI